MGDILQFKRPRPGGNILCRNGHHKWRIEKERTFDVKQGGLVTSYRCSRCQAHKTKAH